MMRMCFRARALGWSALVLALVALPGVAATGAGAAERAVYVGSKSCSQCHEEQYGSYTRNSRKAHSWKAVSVMLPKLEERELKACYECHTTGYGKPGGFVSIEATPGLADVGCESCHGPGSLHAESGDPALIKRKPALKDCQGCHNSERVADFKFKPLMAAGAH